MIVEKQMITIFCLAIRFSYAIFEILFMCHSISNHPMHLLKISNLHEIWFACRVYIKKPIFSILLKSELWFWRYAPSKIGGFAKKGGTRHFLQLQYLRNHLEDLNKFGVILKEIAQGFHFC